MIIHFPQVRIERIGDWAKQLTVVLNEAFAQVEPKLRPGVIVLWDDGTDVPGGFLAADGQEYPSITYPALAKLYGESTPGNFEVPDVTAPAGSVAIVKT